LALLIYSEAGICGEDVLKPLRINKPPTIDGRIQDPVWKKAPFATGFKTYVPDFEIDMAEKTVVYMAYTTENLYFAFRCFDSQPEKIKSSISSRDNIRSDDWICVNVDSFKDQQALYAFYVNPLGIQQDSYYYSSGKEDYSVDFVWYSAGQIDKEGYTVEVQIPFKSLRFANKEKVEMGILFERSISRKSERGTFPAMSPKRGHFYLTQMMPMELENIKHYTLLELLPAFTQSKKFFLDEGKLEPESSARDLSLTAKYGITSNLILDATYNPDFSQIEADAGQMDTNLRYDLFFPEKRPFFLEGSENFDIAATSDLNPFKTAVHTRKIIDPRVGLKLTGKIGKKDTIASIFALDESPPQGQGVPLLNKYAAFTIFRYKRSLPGDSFLGLIYTGREIQQRFNRVLGFDSQIRLNESSVLSFHAFASMTRESDLSPKTEGHALSFDYIYDTRNSTINIELQDISKNFEIDSGYITRTGLRHFRLSLSPKFYPPVSFIRRIDITISNSLLQDFESDLFEGNNKLTLSFLSWRNSRISVEYQYSSEIFLAQRFSTSGWQLSASSQFTKQLYFRLSLKHGKSIRYLENPYQGYGKVVAGTLTFQPSDKLNLNFNLTYSDFFRESKSEKIFDYTIIRNKITYQMNKYLFFRAIAEYNSFRKELLADFLASFTYIPGTVIQFGYGSLYGRLKWENGEYKEASQFLETKRGIFFKASYLWRL